MAILKTLRPLRMNKRKSILLAYSVITIIILSTIAGALFSVPVLALPPALLKARTIGELIITLFAGAGTAISNPVVVPAIYSNYSTADYSLENLVNDGIIYDPNGQMSKAEIIDALGTQEIGAPRAFNLDTEGFRELMATNWQEMTDNGIDAVMRFNNIANTDSVYGAIDNLGQLFLDVANYGYLGTENMIAIVANPGTTVQVAFENIKDAILNKYRNNIETANPITVTIDNDALSNNYKGGILLYSPRLNFYRSYNMFYDSQYIVSIINKSAHSGDPICLVNLSTVDVSYHWAYKNDTKAFEITQPANPDVVPARNKDKLGGIAYEYNVLGTYGADYIVNSDAEMQSLIEDLLDGTVVPQPKYSPDLINQTQGNIYNPIEVVPNLTDQGLLQIIPQDEYVDLIDVVNNNTDNGNPESNAIVLDNFIEDYLLNVNDPGTEDPGDYPEQPVQPTVIPRPTNIPQETEDVINSLGTPGLETIFPFCLPFDLDYLFRKFQAEPRAPYFVLPLKSELFGIDEEVIIDLSMFDDIASLLRTLISIGYIVFLIFNTRSMIGAGSNG